MDNRRTVRTMNEAYFTFEGKLNKDTLKPFKRELIPYGLNLFINSAITLFGLVAVFYFCGKFYRLAGICFFNSIAVILMKQLSQLYLIHSLNKVGFTLFSDTQEYRLLFYPEFFDVIRKHDNKIISIYYSHVNKIIEKDSYIIIILTENLCFPFYADSEQRDLWFDFIYENTPESLKIKRLRR